jgi:hypothetical protein
MQPLAALIFEEPTFPAHPWPGPTCPGLKA